VILCVPCVEVAVAVDPELWIVVAALALAIPAGVFFVAWQSLRWLALSSWHRLDRQERQKALEARLRDECQSKLGAWSSPPTSPHTERIPHVIRRLIEHRSRVG
jgi:hypothetical protein